MTIKFIVECKKVVWIFACAMFALSSAAQDGPLVDSVNPMIGAITYGGFGGHGLGKTFPGAATPFGMVQLSPDTITGGDNGPGYSYHHMTIEGFSFTHLSGIGWYGEFGNFQVMPTVGVRILDREEAKSMYSHDVEIAKAGYYGVNLKRYGVQVELTAAPRAGMMRMTYPESKASRIQIDLARRVGQKSRWLKFSSQQIRVVDDRTIEGYMKCLDKDGGWGRGEGKVNYTQFFRAEFSKPFKAFGVWDKDRVFEGLRDYTGTNTGFFAEFETTEGEQVLLKAGFSYVSLEGARMNLAHDLPTFNFDEAYAKARRLWCEALDAVQVEGGTERERTIFATALYHAMIDPRLTADMDGHYPGSDWRAHRSGKFNARTVFSGWDVFRSQFPLLTLIRPDVVNDTINSLQRVMVESGRMQLARWDILGCDSGCMLGHPAIPVMLDAYEKGIRNFDVELAYEQAKITLGGCHGRPPRFVPGDLSSSLENAYAAWCVAKLGERLGKSAEDIRWFMDYANAYTNNWCADVKWMRARLDDAKDAPGKPNWLAWRGKTVHEQGTTESNPYQQGWFVPHDVDGLISLLGGKDAFCAELERFFDSTPQDMFWNDYYNHPNEPNHHVPFLFVPAGKPHLTQKWTRTICERAYDDNVLGLCGNDDVGQMSAWYVLAAIGLHPICPGDGKWIITSPIFDKVTIRLDPKYFKGKTFTVIARNNSSKNIYIRSMKLNGKPLNRHYLTYEEVSNGGVLELEMSDRANATGIYPFFYNQKCV